MVRSVAADYLRPAVLDDLVEVRRPREHLARRIGIEADLGRQRDEVVGAEHAPALLEVGGVHRLQEALGDERILALCPQRETMRIAGVAGHRANEVVVKAFAGCNLGDVGHHRERFITTYPVLRREVVDRRCRRGARRRIELERAVHDLHLIGDAPLRQGTLQATLADVAPGTHDISPDFDLHGAIVT